MGSTLEHGIYLPSEGEKNCYQGLASNWNKVDGALGDIAELKQSIESKFTKEIVTELPTEDINPFCIYMILKTDPETNNIYDEWVYINNTWEYLGNTQVDMTQYYTKQEVNELPAVASGVTSTKVGNYDTHLADSNIHVTANDKSKWNTVALIKQLRLVNTQVGSATTIAFANIDDTNGIKVGDKCMDLDAKLFEITAVDTTNQTVTVGSALIDLALDANVVHTSGNETISGDKVFNNRLIKNIDVVLGTAPSTGKFSNIDIADNNKASLLQILGGVYDTGNSYVRFFVQNKTADDGTGLSPTGTLRGCGFNINLPATSTSDGQGSIIPRANKTTDFGLVSYQWRNLWCEKLFLNGTQLEPSAFVTTDTNQTISGDKTWTGANAFKQNITYERTNFYHQNVSPCYILKDTELEKGSLASTHTAYPGLWQDKNSNVLGYVRFVEYSSGWQRAEFRVSNLIKNGTLDPTGSEVNCTVYLELQPSGEKSLIPEQNNDINLGTVSNKWKTFNGLTPSSLSLPSNTGYVDISSYFTNTGDGQTNSYTASANGWIYLNVNATKLVMQIRDSNDNVVYADMCNRSNDGTIYMTIPISSGNKLLTQWFTSSTVTITTARFIPCQGNV